MTERERLIKLLNSCPDTRMLSCEEVHGIIDYLLANGVRLPVTCGECNFAVDDCAYGLPNTIRCTFWGDVDENVCAMPNTGYCCFGERRADNESNDM